MSEAPERIWAAPPTDDPYWTSGAGEWDVSDNWAADLKVEYVRADRIEELEAETERLKRQYAEVISDRPYIVGWNDGYDYAEHGDETRDVPDVVEVLVAKRTEELEAKLGIITERSNAIEQANTELEAKLAKAVEALKKMNVGEGWAAQIARTTLAELTGGNDETSIS